MWKLCNTGCRATAEGPGQMQNTSSVNILPLVPKISKAISRITFSGGKKKGHWVGFKAVKRQRINRLLQYHWCLEWSATANLGAVGYSLFSQGILRLDDIYLLALVSEVEHGIDEQKIWLWSCKDTEYSTWCWVSEQAFKNRCTNGEKTLRLAVFCLLLRRAP